jgi:hypothetical protein
MLKAAQELEKYGLKTFPLAKERKTPIAGVSWKKQLLVPVQQRFQGLDNPNIAIATGPESGVLGVDLDHGATEHDLAMFPRTWTVRSRDGWHIYFKWTDRLKKQIQPLFGGTNNQATAHVRGIGHYFVAPPSVVAWDEKTNQTLEPWEYTWLSDVGGELKPGECELAEVPEWMLECFDNQKELDETGNAVTTPGTGVQRNVVEGQRHNDLVGWGLWLWCRETDESVVARKMRERNASYAVPKPTDVVETEIANLLKWYRQRHPVMGLLADKQASTNHEQPVGNEAGNGYESCVYPLGYNGRKYYFISRSNFAIVCLGSQALCSSSLCELMPREFWEKYFPKRDKNGVPVAGSADWVGAGSTLMEACRKRGIFSEASAARGSGVWEIGPREIIYHRGDQVVTVEHGERHVLDASGDGVVYQRDRQLPALTESELTADEGKLLVAACSTLQWRTPKSNLILAGWLATAPFCGALRKRPHVEIIAPPGVGKTDFVDAVVGRVLGRRAVMKRGSETTEAGIRQDMKMAAMPVVCDDIELSEENDTTNGRIEKVVVLSRSAYDATPDKLITKGTADGEGQQFRCVSSFMVCAVASPLREPQDRSRFVSLLARKTKDPVKQAEEEAVARQAYARIDTGFGDRLFTRMFRRWKQYRESVGALNIVLAGKCHGRLAENLSVLLGGVATLTQDHALTVEEAYALVEGIQFNSFDRAEKDTLEEKCLGAVLSHQIDITQRDLGGRIDRVAKVTVARAIEDFLDSGRDVTDDQDERVKVDRSELQRHGFDVHEGQLIIRTTNDALKKALPKNQAVQFGLLLAQVPGAVVTRHRFGGRYTNPVACVRVPLAQLGAVGENSLSNS